MKDSVTRSYEVRMRRGDKPIIVRGQQLSTYFGPYPHGPAITGTRVVLTSSSGNDHVRWIAQAVR